MNDTLSTSPARIEVDPTATGHVLMIVFDDDGDLDTSIALRLTPRMAAKLGQKLIDVAASVEEP
jgi:hypothetical protein